jgi:hypothetical protein
MNIRGKGNDKNFAIRSPWSDSSTIDVKMPRTASARTLCRRFDAYSAAE